MTIKAKYYSAKCPLCSEPIRVGQEIEWTKGKPAQHSVCPKRLAELKANAFEASKRAQQKTWEKREAYRLSGQARAQITVNRNGTYTTWDVYIPETDNPESKFWHHAMTFRTEESAIEWCQKQGYQYFF